MNKQDDGGPAFPVPGNPATMPGMTLRDWFAGQAMQAMLTAFTNTGESSDPESPVFGFFNREGAIDTNHKTGEHDGANEIAHDAYTIADAMLAARKETT